jgi:hypothetical protein
MNRRAAGLHGEKILALESKSFLLLVSLGGITSSRHECDVLYGSQANKTEEAHGATDQHKLPGELFRVGVIRLIQ